MSVSSVPPEVPEGDDFAVDEWGEPAPRDPFDALVLVALVCGAAVIATLVFLLPSGGVEGSLVRSSAATETSEATRTPGAAVDKAPGDGKTRAGNRDRDRRTSDFAAISEAADRRLLNTFGLASGATLDPSVFPRSGGASSPFFPGDPAPPSTSTGSAPTGPGTTPPGTTPPGTTPPGTTPPVTTTPPPPVETTTPPPPPVETTTPPPPPPVETTTPPPPPPPPVETTTPPPPPPVETTTAPPPVETTEPTLTAEPTLTTQVTMSEASTSTP